MVPKNRIYIYSLCDIFYDSYYYKGLKEFYNYKIIFSKKKFPDFEQGTFAVIIIKNGKQKKIIIDSRDQFDILENQLKWCDIYGKVNYRTSEINLDIQNKVIPISPSFGINIWNKKQTIFYGISNYFKSFGRLKFHKRFFANYKEQLKRPKIEDYNNTNKSKNNYIFFAGTTWKFEQQTNLYRALFIKVCRKLSFIDFEGGLTPRNDKFDAGFKEFEVSKRYSIDEYFEKLKESMVVFNTPAVLKCHGWKLGEFFALGKAIISTPHVIQFPSDIINETHMIMVDEIIENEFENAIEKLSKNESFRFELESNAKKYFDEYLAPKSVIRILDSKLF